MSYADIENFIKTQGLPKFRTKQIWEWVYEHRVIEWEGMTNLPVSLRNTLGNIIPLASLSIERSSKSCDMQTEKLLLKTLDNEYIESVLMHYHSRKTVCVSTQVGCAQGCVFCASTRGGCVRSLSSVEILEQVLSLASISNSRVSNVVFMGIGEPFDNYTQVCDACILLKDRLGIGYRKQTISTVGIPDKMRSLAKDVHGVSLALSLHAPNQELREKLIPAAKRYPLKEVLKAARDYADKAGHSYTIEYALFDGINDSTEHAIELVSLLRKEPCKVNLIPCNSTTSKYRAPTDKAVRNFQSILEQSGIIATIRLHRGSDINAACGQLRHTTKS